MNKLCFLLVMVLGILISCGRAHEEGQASLTLNNGEKWQVNAEMLPHITEAKDLLNEFVQTESNNYAQLAKDLKQHNDDLIASCTMKGKSHDELHKWLHPHMQLVDKLSKAKSPEEGQNLVKQLQDSFAVFEEYFE